MITITTDADLRGALQLPFDPRMKALLQRRRDVLDFDLPFETMAKFIVVEAGDDIPAIDAELGFSITYDRFSCCLYGSPGFAPSWEWVLEHDHCYETVFVLSDDGYAVVLFIQKLYGVDADLIAMMKAYMA